MNPTRSVWTIRVCPDGGSGGESPCHRNCGLSREVRVVALSDVVEVLENGYAPQNPTAHHPADWIEQHFEHVPGTAIESQAKGRPDDETSPPASQATASGGSSQRGDSETSSHGSKRG